ncbi:hypothetical protein ACP70R_012987 [Stipagrostis hirtigluma subsp. patula]
MAAAAATGGRRRGSGDAAPGLHRLSHRIYPSEQILDASPLSTATHVAFLALSAGSRISCSMHSV